jgi:hypothetical protein
MNQFVSQPLLRDPMRDQLVHQVQRVPCRGSKPGVQGAVPDLVYCTLDFRRVIYLT